MIKYTVEHSVSGVVILQFVGNGIIDEYPPEYQSLAEAADTGKTFSQTIEGEIYTSLIVTSEDYTD